MKKRALYLAMAGAMTGAMMVSGATYAETSTSDVQRQLDQAQQQLNQAIKTIQDLQKRVNQLEKDKPAAPPLGVMASHPVAPTGTQIAGVPVIAPDSVPEPGIAGADKARVEFRGQVMLDAIQDFNRVDPDWNAALRPSKIPVVCAKAVGDPHDAGCGDEGETILSIRQSKFGFRGFVPTELGEIKTIMEFDLFSVNGSSAFRVQTAWAELGNYGFGQYYTTFMDADVFPNTIEYWGPNGMVFIRNPQLRYTPYNKDGWKWAMSLEAPGSALDTGKVSEIDTEAFGAYEVSSHTELPDFATHVRLDGDWGHAQLAGLLRKLSFDTPNRPGARPSGSETGYGVNLSGVLNTWGSDRIVAQFAIGKGIAGYMNDGGNDIAPEREPVPGLNPGAEALESIGWLLFYDHYWNDKWSSSIGYSEHSQDNSDGQLAEAYKKGDYALINLLYTPIKNFMVGAEGQWGSLEHNNGEKGEDSRIQFSSRYSF
jgi:hypothetical protein